MAAQTIVDLDNSTHVAVCLFCETISISRSFFPLNRIHFICRGK